MSETSVSRLPSAFLQTKLCDKRSAVFMLAVQDLDEPRTRSRRPRVVTSHRAGTSAQR